MLEDRSMRELLGPVAAVALIAQLNPDLPAPRIEFAPIHHDNGEYSTGFGCSCISPRTASTNGGRT
ncbi:hypothetical protein SAMN05428942_2126 [Streptomyces sp. 2112.2]|uniref:hypothetical protein n=1 Tax=Streptomyces sp. 2112.2 TaxID=1881024 RepID=UPI0008999E23|nr:hypothetical protein [Streptomyces sp. 2112.2]SED61057.1 hypothetical protein SAMN05428942_2126 [Streptomyces sp. 2112.2]